MSLRRQNPWMLKNISARALFVGGMVILPAYLLQESLMIRVGQVIVFGWLTTVAGKKLLWPYFITIVIAITGFHVLVPTGAVLFEVGTFPVTAGGLRNGVFKALTIIGMVFLSLVSVRADLRIPGTVGAIAGKLFWSFEQIMERRDRVKVSAPLRTADEMLLELYESLVSMGDAVADTVSRKATAQRTTVGAIVVICGVVGAQWALLLVSLP